MNASTYAAKIKAEMENIKNSMVEPGYSELGPYREQLARYHAFKDALDRLKLTIDEDNE